jgi:hypothetical protein
MIVASAGAAHGAGFDYRFEVGVEKAFGDLPQYLPTQLRPWKPADALLHARVDLGALLAERVFVGPFLDGGVALSCQVEFCLFYRVGASRDAAGGCDISEHRVPAVIERRRAGRP